MAVTLIPEDPPAAGSIASSTSSNAAVSTVAPIKGYRLLAMYRNVTGVAASFDSSGGFAQWPNGQLMLVWNKLKREGRAYNADGTTSCSFTARRCGADLLFVLPGCASMCGHIDRKSVV